MADSLFTSQTPAVEASDGSPGITTGTSFVPDADGTITHVRFYAGASVAGTYTGLFWEVDSNDDGFGGTGTLLGSDAFPGAPTGGAWNLIELDPPVPVTAGVLYRVGMHNPSRYVATNSFFVTPPGLITGHLHAPEDGADPVGLGSMRQGTFTIDASPSYPRQAGASASYFIDVVFVADGGSNDLTAAITLPALQASAVLAAGSALASAMSLPALQASAVLAAAGTVAAPITLPALQASAALAARAALASALTLPRLSLAAVLSVPAAPVEDTSSPNTALSTASRVVVLTTISRECVITTGTRGGPSA